VAHRARPLNWPYPTRTSTDYKRLATHYPVVARRDHRQTLDGVITSWNPGAAAARHARAETGPLRLPETMMGCGYAFFDLSKNRSATWCSMSICGNRSENRACYQRRRPDSTAH
jgi:predicted RNA-binding Zn ribbon-like protein